MKMLFVVGPFSIPASEEPTVTHLMGRYRYTISKK